MFYISFAKSAINNVSFLYGTAAKTKLFKVENTQRSVLRAVIFMQKFDSLNNISSKGSRGLLQFLIPNHYLQFIDPKPLSVVFQSQMKIRSLKFCLNQIKIIKYYANQMSSVVKITSLCILFTAVLVPKSENEQN